MASNDVKTATLAGQLEHFAQSVDMVMETVPPKKGITPPHYKVSVSVTWPTTKDEPEEAERA